MKRFALIGVWVAVLAVGIAGCDWDTGSDADSWNSDYNWVNFSGTYRGIGGGMLVTDYTTTPSIPGVTNIYTATQSGGTMPAGGGRASGQVAHGSIVPGSVMITVGNNATLSDPGKNGILTGNGAGTVNYEGGTWSIELNAAAIDVANPHPIKVTYSYTISSDGTSSSGAQSGATGKIYAFNLVQKGENLTITDSNGAVYTGKIGEMRTTSGVERDDEVDSFMPQDGDTMIATIECTGTSAALMQVKIVGSLQGTVASSIFTDRRLNGTWIESAGKTGNIYGQTTAVAIPTDTGTTVDSNSTAMVVSP